MMFLDVVYNHFGPEGNYLQLYAPDFFHPEHHTPWGAAIAYEKRPVRDFFIENALYWLEEYRFDGLRLDAVDQIAHQSESGPGGDRRASAAASDRHFPLTPRTTATSQWHSGRRGRVNTIRRMERRVHHGAHLVAHEPRAITPIMR